MNEKLDWNQGKNELKSKKSIKMNKKQPKWILKMNKNE